MRLKPKIWIHLARFIHEKIKYQILGTPELGFNGADWYFINILRQKCYDIYENVEFILICEYYSAYTTFSPVSTEHRWHVRLKYEQGYWLYANAGEVVA
jgi:hypothetical protein